MNEQEVITLMESSSTLAEWESNCDEVQEACDGYPPFWYKSIIASGLADRVAAKWGGDAKIHIISL